MRNIGTVLALSILLATPSTTRAQQDPPAGPVTAPPPPARKEPVVAGVLGVASGLAFLPGMGSFYAGNSGHGARHLLIGLGALGVAGASIVRGLSCANEGHDGCAAGSVLLYLTALGTYLGNYLWSITTAVSDANAFNRRYPQPQSPGLQPAVIDLSSKHPASSSLWSLKHRIGLGLLVSF